MEELISYIEKIVKLNEEEKILLNNYFKPEFVKKRQTIIQPNFTATHRYFVLDGAFRAYLICREGQEHTIQFALEDWWITDYNSYMEQDLAKMFVVALEDSKVLKISYQEEQELKSKSHTFETFFRIMAEKASAAMQKRIISNLTQTAESRYESFSREYSKVVQRVPQYALASYLGISTEYLSRLRNKRVSKSV